MPDRFRVEVAPSQYVTAINYSAATGNRAGVTLILGHGAGADQTNGFMVAFANALAERGIGVVTFNFLYSEYGRRIPDPNRRLESCWRAVIETDARPDQPQATINWRSAASRWAGVSHRRSPPAPAVIWPGWCFSAIPCIRPAGPIGCAQPTCETWRLRCCLSKVRATRSARLPNCNRSSASSSLPADLFVVEGGDHSFKLPTNCRGQTTGHISRHSGSD